MSSEKRGSNAEHTPLVLVDILQALADPVRLEIVRQLDQSGEKACGTFGIDMPKSSMSHHFSLLRKTGVLTFEKKGAQILNRLQRASLNAQFPGVLDSVLSAAHKQVRASQKARLR